MPLITAQYIVTNKRDHILVGYVVCVFVVVSTGAFLKFATKDVRTLRILFEKVSLCNYDFFFTCLWFI